MVASKSGAQGICIPYQPNFQHRKEMTMFVELKQLLAARSLTITVAMLSNDQMRVNVVPNSSPDDKKANEKIGYSHKEVASIPEEAINALTTPVSITGTAEEIDANLPTVLSKYVESHAQLQESFSRASTEISEAVKAIDERNKVKKEKDKAAKKEDRSKAETETKKDEDLLPLWAAGSAQPNSKPDSNNDVQSSLVTQPAEAAQS
jgi:PRTRC genetic system protein E